MKIVLTGAMGFVGRPLVSRLLSAGHTLVVLTRGSSRSGPVPGLEHQTWDARTPGGWVRRLEGVEAVINLAGEPLAVWPWTQARKRRIWDSRVEATRALVSACAGISRPPRVWVNASAIGVYGVSGETLVDERAPAGNDFLARLCRTWEAEAAAARRLGTRVVCLRLGLVLGQDGGVLTPLATAFRWYLGGPLGSGRQWVSWVQREDVVSALDWVLSQKDLDGPVNLTAPEAVRMRDLCRVLGKVLRRPSWVRVPGPLLRLGLGDMALLLEGGQRVSPSVLKERGFAYAHSDLEEALRVSLPADAGAGGAR